MPTLDWIGKDKVINHHLDVPYRVLERQYSYDENGQHTENNGSENMIIHGDNLSALKSLLPQYEGRIKCIYIDPPIKKWLGEVVGKEGEDLSRHDKWLSGLEICGIIMIRAQRPLLHSQSRGRCVCNVDYFVVVCPCVVLIDFLLRHFYAIFVWSCVEVYEII